MAKEVYGQSYTDKDTQRKMVKFMKVSSRLGKAQPKTQLNKDSVPKNDFFGNPRTLKSTKGSPVGSELQERVNNKPKSIPKRLESQKTNYKPGSERGKRPPNSKVNRRYK